MVRTDLDIRTCWAIHSGTRGMLQAALIVLILTYVVHFIFLGFLVGPYDYDHLSAYYELAWRFWKTQISLPHFNPYLCGGRTLGADPQIPIFNPVVLLVPILGSTVVVRWEILTQLVLGTLGLVGWLRMWKVSTLGMLWGVLLYVGGGGVTARLMVGHFTLGFLLLLPLFFYLAYRLDETSGRTRQRVLIGYCLLFIYCGLYKPNFLICGIPLLAVEALFRSLVRKKVYPLIWLGFGVFFCVFCNAVSYLPAWHYFNEFPRTSDAELKYIPIYSFLANILLPLKGVPKAFYGTGFMQRHEYSIFIGPVALWFALCGMKSCFTMRDLRAWILLALLFFACLLGLGAYHDGFIWWLPYTWFLPLWPGFESIRVPTRFWYAAYVVLIVFSALGFRAPKKKLSQIILVVIGILPVVITAVVNLSKVTVRSEMTQWSVRAAFPSDIQMKIDHPDKAFAYIRRGIGVLHCTNNIQAHIASSLHEGSLLGIQPENYPIKAQWLAWNTIAVQGQSKSPFKFSFNLNHSPYWNFKGSGAKIISSLFEPLGLQTYGNTFSGELIFTQPWVREGLWISFFGWSVLIVWLLVAFFRRQV